MRVAEFQITAAQARALSKAAAGAERGASMRLRRPRADDPLPLGSADLMLEGPRRGELWLLACELSAPIPLEEPPA